MNTKKRLPFYTAIISSAIIALFSLTGCEYFADPSGSAPVIAAYAQPDGGASTISIIISGGFFNTSATIDDFTIGGDYVDNGGTVGEGTGVNAPTATQFYFDLDTPIPTDETITIQALTTAFSPAAKAASNTVTFTAL